MRYARCRIDPQKVIPAGIDDVVVATRVPRRVEARRQDDSAGLGDRGQDLRAEPQGPSGVVRDPAAKRLADRLGIDGISGVS